MVQRNAIYSVLVCLESQGSVSETSAVEDKRKMDDTPTQYSFLEVRPIFSKRLFSSVLVLWSPICFMRACVLLFIQLFEKRLS